MQHIWKCLTQKSKSFWTFVNLQGVTLTASLLILHHGVVTVSDEFMELIEGATREEGFDDSWDLDRST